MNHQGTGCIGTSQNRFLWLNIYQTDARYGGSRLTNLAERHRRNDWRETLFDSQDIISELK